jgi:hypothetical protein
LTFEPNPSGRKSKQKMKDFSRLQNQLSKLSPEDRKFVLAALPKHKLEIEFDINAERILDAIARASDLTKRGIRGIIAEEVFIKDALPLQLKNTEWSISDTAASDSPYDAVIKHSRGFEVSIQVKNQRVERGTVKVVNGKWIVEVQKTRTGRNPDGKATRPYRFEDFDIIAVCLWPGTKDWNRFAYCLTKNLIPRKKDPNLIQIMQPIPTCVEEGTWTSSLPNLLRNFEI